MGSGRIAITRFATEALGAHNQRAKERGRIRDVLNFSEVSSQRMYDEASAIEDERDGASFRLSDARRSLRHSVGPLQPQKSWSKRSSAAARLRKFDKDGDGRLSPASCES